MKLVITTSQSLDEMQELVARTFAVTTKKQEKPMGGETMTASSTNKKNKKNKQSQSPQEQQETGGAGYIDPLIIPPLDHSAAMKRLVLVAPGRWKFN
jgi:secreted Zn-dependent insulinase-like peptidase